MIQVEKQSDIQTADANPPVTPDSLFQIGLGMMACKTLLSAIELGVFAELAKGPRELQPLVAAVGLHSRSARDFLDALVALNILERTDGTTPVYRNGPAAAQFLDPAKPTYIGGIFKMANERLYPAWGRLSDALRTGKPQGESAELDTGATFDAIYDNEAHVERFASAMTGISLGNAHALSQKLDWKNIKTVCDIGCAQGAVPVTLARLHPHLQTIGYDLPAVKTCFEKYAKANGVDDRARFEPGDFFKQPLPKTDCLVFGHILHDWDLPTKQMLLKKAHEALPKGGRLIIYDAIIDDERRQNAFGLLMSLNMLVETHGGFDYTGADLRRWLNEAGFDDIKIEPLTGPHSMAVATKR